MKIWGLEYSELIVDGQIWWRPKIRNPFYDKGKWTIGLNEKFLRLAIETGVVKFLIRIGNKDVMMTTPTKKQMRMKVKNGEYNDKDSMFENSQPMRIFYFSI